MTMNDDAREQRLEKADERIAALEQSNAIHAARLTELEARLKRLEGDRDLMVRLAKYELDSSDQS